MKHYKIIHKTSYQYQAPVILCHNLGYLIPRNTEFQTARLDQISISPLPAHAHQWEDYFGNQVYQFSIQEPHSNLEVKVISQIQLQPIAQRTVPSSVLNCASVLDSLMRSQEERIRLSRDFCLSSPNIELSAELAQYSAPLFTPETNFMQAVIALCEKIYTEFEYDPEVTTVSTPVRDVLLNRHGVCQDFAQLMIACLRSMGFAARYVSGYLETLPAPGKAKLVGSDASHAWLSVLIPDYGWLDCDPTNNLLVGDQHITTAWGRDYQDITPLRGVLFGGGQDQQLEVSVDVQPLSPAPETFAAP